MRRQKSITKPPKCQDMQHPREMRMLQIPSHLGGMVVSVALRVCCVFFFTEVEYLAIFFENLT